MALDPEVAALLGTPGAAPPATQAIAPAAVLDPEVAALMQGAANPAPPPPPTGGQHFAATVGALAQHPFTFGTGMLENAIGGIGGTVGKLGGRLADLATGTPNNFAQRWAQALQYQPRTAAGQQIQSLTGDEGAAI